MKHLYSSLQAKKIIAFLKRITISVICLSFAFISFSQEFVFRKPVLKSGHAGNDGVVYRFANVATNVDALVTINGRSSSLVTLDSIDVTSTGYDKAFQPLVTYNGGTVRGPATWWMEFQVTFVKSGTDAGVTLDTVNATALDIDGDGTVLQEQFTAYGTANYTLNMPTSLSMAAVSGGARFTSAIANGDGIDTANAKLRVTLNYVNINTIKFRYGGQVTGNSQTTTAGNRFNSIWFKAFKYTAPSVKPLPVYLLSFNAQLNSSKVTLDWITSAEMNASHFVVQRSRDGAEFDDQAVIFTDEGNSQIKREYNYKDNINGIEESLLYYRLKMVDLDGKYNYSAVEVIRLGKQQSQLSLQTFPNPAVNELRVTIPNDWQNKSVAYTIYNVNGSLMKQLVNGNSGQTETLNISDLPLGLYIIRAANGNETTSQKFLKIK